MSKEGGIMMNKWKYISVMRRLLGFLFLFMAVVLLNGCILSASPPSPVTLKVLEPCTFEIRTFPIPTNFIWTLDGVVVPAFKTRYYTYIPGTADIGDHNVSVTETSIFGKGTHSWVVHVQAEGLNHIADLSSLIISQGTLTPAFQSGTLSYTTQVPDAVSSLTVTPTSAGVNATITVNSSTVVSGQASTPIPLSVGDTTITIVVKAEDGTTIKTYTIVVTRSNPGLTTRDQAQDALYTAYAGIGYNRADSTYDDAPLYDIMLNDLNTVAGDFVINTIFDDPNLITKLLAVLLGGSRTFNDTTIPGVVSSVYVNPGATKNGYLSFSGNLTVKFDATTGYPWNNCLYYGSGTCVAAITADVTGYLKATSAGLDELYVHSVMITAMNTLKAVYPYPIGEVDYNQWKIAYVAYYGENDPDYTSGASTIPMNAYILPILITYPVSTLDYRDYTLSGGFTLNGNAYAFPETGIRYRQWQPESQTLLSVNGKLTIPGLTGVITVSSPEDIIDPVGSGTINRSTTGIWTSGHMNLNASEVLATFINNGTCDFSGDLGTWSVASWQINLKP
jgi:hypothetical protein